MNKRMIVLIVLMAVVSLMPASAETLEVRGNVVELDAANSTLAADRVWDYSSFAGFWYDMDDDLQTESLTILAINNWNYPTLKYPYDRTLDEGTLIYGTHPMFREYEMHQDIPDSSRTTQTDMEEDWDGDGISDKDMNGNEIPGTGSDLLDRDIGLCVESDNPGGDCGYFVEGWMAEKYVAIDGNADKLCKLLVEFEDDDAKTLSTDEEWDLGSGYSLTANLIDLEGEKVWFSLKKNGRELDNEVASIGEGTAQRDRVYTYTADIGNEEDVPVFSCYVDAVFGENDTNTIRLMYVFLIDDDVLEIDTSDTYGAMEVMTASANRVVLTNDETTIDLDTGSTEHIMGNMYFKTADDDNAIRFYPFVEHTIGSEEPTPPTTIPATDSDHDGVPDVWDADNSTPSDYWVNSDGIGRKWGDMNGDGELTSADALMILQAAVGKIELD